MHDFFLGGRALLLAITLFSAGCGDRNNGTGSPDNDSVRAITARDARGELLTLSAPARRVVSLAPNLTEIVCAVGAEGRLVGRTDYCNYPPSIDSIPSVGDIQNPNFEKIFAAHPDIVLMSIAGNSESVYDKLKELGLHTFVLDAGTIDATIDAIDTVGYLVGYTADARTITTTMRHDIDSIRRLSKREARVTTFMLIDKSPLITVSHGFLAEALETAGGENIAKGAVAPYPVFSREEVLKRDPEVILLVSPARNALSELLELYPEWKGLQAVRTGRVYTVDPDIVSRPGPRISEGIKLLHHLIHGRGTEGE